MHQLDINSAIDSAEAEATTTTPTHQTPLSRQFFSFGKAMRNPDFVTSFPWTSRVIYSLSIAGCVLIAGEATCQAQKPDSSQVEFDPMAELPMDIMKGTKPATMADAQFAGAETETFVTISPSSNSHRPDNSKQAASSEAASSVKSRSVSPAADTTTAATTPTDTTTGRKTDPSKADPASPPAAVVTPEPSRTGARQTVLTSQPVLIVASAPDSGVVAGEPVSVQVKKPAPLSTRTLSQLDQLTTRLVSQSRDAWLRGLMDQASYAAWLDVASTTQLRIAAHQGDRNRALLALQEQVALWTEAASELEAFNQPASRGWEADLSHSRVMAFRAELRYSIAAGRQLTIYDQQAYAQLAARHLDLRLQDFRTGTGTAASVLAAATMVDEQVVVPQQASESSGFSADFAVPDFRVDRPSAMRAALAEIRRPVHLETYPIAISTRDLAEDRQAVRHAATFAAFAGTPSDVRATKNFLTELEQQAEEISARQFARLQTGTATPGGMLREWWQQESIAAGLQEDLSETAFHAGQTQRLQAIHQAAAATTDLRGRNAADVAAVEMLVAVRQLDLKPASGEKKTAPHEKTPSASEALVIEYKKNKATSDR